MVTPPYEWPTAFCMKKYIQYTPFVVLQIFSVFAKIFLDIPIVRSERSNKTLMTRDITTVYRLQNLSYSVKAR